MRNGFRHRLHIRDVVDVEIVVVGAGINGIEFDKVDSSRCIKIDDGVDVPLRAWLGVVDLVATAKGVLFLALSVEVRERF